MWVRLLDGFFGCSAGLLLLTALGGVAFLGVSVADGSLERQATLLGQVLPISCVAAGVFAVMFWYEGERSRSSFVEGACALGPALVAFGGGYGLFGPLPLPRLPGVLVSPHVAVAMTIAGAAGAIVWIRRRRLPLADATDEPLA